MSFRKPLLESLFVLISYQVWVKSYLKRSRGLIKHGSNHFVHSSFFPNLLGLVGGVHVVLGAPEEFFMTEGWFVMISRNNRKDSVTLLSSPHISLSHAPPTTHTHTHSSMPPAPEAFTPLLISSLFSLLTNFYLSLRSAPLMGTALNLLDHYRCKLYRTVLKRRIFKMDRSEQRKVEFEIYRRVIVRWWRRRGGLLKSSETDSLKASHVCKLFTLPLSNVSFHQQKTSIELHLLTSANQWLQFLNLFSLRNATLYYLSASLLVCKSFFQTQCPINTLDSNLQR